MPYINKKNRAELNPLIDQLSEKIANISKTEDHDAAFAGLLNYTSTRLALKVVKLRFGKMRYWIVASLTGVFKNVSDEFYRRLASPYEDKQIEKNGDVDIYEELDKEIRGL
ncbi:MAG: hypothetical protein COU46_03255 [Candidatus Niyogibacteria bacterium CG10_big_fil_rev_8_21_14_0_10_42_19]|uniref:Uncharacterized protein n=1 Tax=Candidatus Niyogibacteria bacterium CG10_big_fil_rev_8_21_14_0_10_42_19 TaxID=1974725 RepID=A0A2H0TF27_9BACT|nr:MAG: hypothetical protein COU46_03255 [Candidatus Niyogibacteria bacterium CG10_big_fil_rev_8_21_14_0_10_42_19]